jgi:hypothetical protein
MMPLFFKPHWMARFLGICLSIPCCLQASSPQAHTPETHWAFQPVKHPPVPQVVHPVSSPTDAFVFAKLEARGMEPSARADKRTLIRRISFDLTGLPPRPEDVAAFLSDESDRAFPELVERLLASPRYGERWGRYWLDVARYADTKGYVFEEERRFAYSYTYRDWVIRAFNQDLPYDRFILEQIAADQLPLGDDKRPLAALGYLTLGRRFLNNPHDIIDDRIDVVTRGMMGLTVSCARCHDHKYDPIPAEDYYSLYGVFANSTEPSEKPLLGGDSLPFQYSDYIAEKEKRTAELEMFRTTKNLESRTEVRRRSGDYLLAAHDISQMSDSGKAEGLARERKLDPGTARRWRNRLDEWRKVENHPIFSLWFAFSDLAADQFETKAPEVLAHTATDLKSGLNPMVALAFAGSPPKSMKEVCDRYGDLLSKTDSLWMTATGETTKRGADALTSFDNPDLEALRLVLYAPDSPANVPENELARLFDVPTSQKLRALQRKLDELDATHPGAPPRAMALIDKPNPGTQHVLLRGNPRTPGAEVPRRFLRILAGNDAKPFEKGSGRLELAQAIASPDNPLTARVFVNRVWAHYFGVGLVRTPSDFGVRCDEPLHSDLLDYLAWQFMENGWSIKHLHRLIVLSQVYQQRSENTPENAAIDPANDLLWRMNRRRLDFEAQRDSLLATAGQIDLTSGGRALELTEAPFTTRRTVFGFIERQNLPNLFRTFDFASPDTTSPHRFTTTVPQQALFMINSPFAIQQARRLARLAQLQSSASDRERVIRLYEISYQRDPDADETDAALAFLNREQSRPASSGDEENREPLEPLEKLAQVLLMANEFVFVD